MAEAQERKYVGLADITPVEGEMEGFDPTASQFETKPIKPGVYPTQLQFSEADPEKRWEEKFYNTAKYPNKVDRQGNPLKYYVTRLTGVIADGEFTGRFVSDRFVSTGIWGDNNTSTIASILNEAGYDLTGVTSQPELCQLFEQYIASEPVMRCKVDWEWTGTAENLVEDEKTGQTKRRVVKGAKNFPDGKASREDEATGELIPARFIITAYYRG